MSKGTLDGKRGRNKQTVLTDEPAASVTFLSLHLLVDEPEGVNMTWEVTKTICKQRKIRTRGQKQNQTLHTLSGKY